ncbi:flagellar hook-basal body protein [Pelagicoccus sp. SDUM812003]|uniref:flagellar hook-basal body protein n=1 Tax=Pelagicoccus sp. SDUM812003 TaxID=3041267 RepID=UPI00280D1911|nr:flagellar hook-basal body protein [Pelagicoccus sp. SDUM812003]MDQ8202554.1 flagellar hook-basal body protein [Pelagicoccus sp. SDUM812003]
MLNGVYQNAAAMTGLEAWNNSIAQNIAQSSTPGYKKAEISFDGVESGKIGVKGAFGDVLQRASIQTRGVSSVDFTSGNIKITNSEFDFALEGDGFFELRAPDGQLVYTRDGQFKLNDDGELVSKQGFHVMSDTRNIIQLVPDGGRLQSAKDGTLRQNGQKIAELSIRGISDPENLIRSHGGFVLGPNSNQITRHLEDPFIRHGALEQSNVSSTTEMINLINVSRSFQVNQKVIQEHDSVLEKAIRALGAS